MQLFITVFEKYRILCFFLEIIVAGQAFPNQPKPGEIPKRPKGSVLKTDRRVKACKGSNPFLPASIKAKVLVVSDGSISDVVTAIELKVDK